MSASIYWSRKGGRHYLDLGAPSSFMEILEEVFSRVNRLELTESDLSTLGAMIAAAEGENKKCLKALYDALSRHGEIIIGV